MAKVARLDRVTLTGADESIDPRALRGLSASYPFVEWGVLLSKNRSTGEFGTTSRYPGWRWLEKLADTDPGSMKLAWHLQGFWLRELLNGRVVFPVHLLDSGDRLQLNFHGEFVRYSAKPFARALRQVGEVDFIFQLDGAYGEDCMAVAMDEEVERCYGLFDTSAGRGILPDRWPKPSMVDVVPGEHGGGEEFWAYCGYAGGLGPENLAEQLPLILQAAGGTGETNAGRIWIDMETKLRSDGGRQFDFRKCEDVLKICEPFIASGK